MPEYPPIDRDSYSDELEVTGSSRFYQLEKTELKLADKIYRQDYLESNGEEIPKEEAIENEEKVRYMLLKLAELVSRQYQPSVYQH